MRLQIVVDDVFGAELQNKAHELGFSVSSYARHLLKNAIGKKNTIDVALSEPSEEISLDDFKKQLEDLKC